jgi:hypothetical protein
MDTRASWTFSSIVLFAALLGLSFAFYMVLRASAHRYDAWLKELVGKSSLAHADTPLSSEEPKGPALPKLQNPKNKRASKAGPSSSSSASSSASSSSFIIVVIFIL